MDKGICGIALVSFARHQDVLYAPYFETHPKVKIVAVGDESTAPDWVRRKNTEWASKHGVPYIEDLDRLLSMSEVDAVSICSEVSRRGRLIVKAAEAGKHVFVDKPIALSLQECDEIASAVAKNGIKLMTAFNTRFDPILTLVRNEVAKGSIGLPSSIHGEVFMAGGINKLSREELAITVDPLLSGGGELMNLACYFIDAVRWISGCEVQSVYAVAGSEFFDEYKQCGVEDLAIITMNLANGVVATSAVGRTPTCTHPAGGDINLRVMGSNGTIIATCYRPSVEVYGSERFGVKSLYYGPDRRGAQVNHFVECLLQNKQPMVTVQDGRAALAVVLAAYQSVAENKVVSLL